METVFDLEDFTACFSKIVLLLKTFSDRGKVEGCSQRSSVPV